MGTKRIFLIGIRSLVALGILFFLLYKIPLSEVAKSLISAEEVKDGKIYLVVIPHIGATVKRLYIEYKNLILKPDNNLYKEKIFPLDALEKEEIRIVGRVFRVRIIKDL